MASDTDFRKKILFSDEAHFWLNGYINKQTCRIWSVDNTQAILKFRYILKKSLFVVLYELLLIDKPETIDALKASIAAKSGRKLGWNFIINHNSTPLSLYL